MEQDWLKMSPAVGSTASDDDWLKSSPAVDLEGDDDWLTSSPAVDQEAEGGILSSIGNIGRGIGERAATLGGGLVRGVATAVEPAGDWLQRNVGDFVQEADGSITWRRLTDEEAAQPSSVLSTGQKTAKALEDTKLGYEQGTSWEDFKASPIKEFIPFALEQGLVSVPDMLAAVANLPAYIASRTGEMGQERAKNNNLDNATVEDLLTVLPGAVASSALERLGARGILADTAVTAAKQLPKAVAKAALKEGVTEAGQELIEYGSTNIGTEAGFDPAEAGERMAAGAVGGVGFGAAARTATAGVEAVTSRQAQSDLAQADAAAREAGYRIDPALAQEAEGGLGAAAQAAPQIDSTPIEPVSQQEAVTRLNTVDLDPERTASPRLTPEDRSSPLPNSLIDDGKAIIDQALAPTPSATPADSSQSRMIRATLLEAGETNETIDAMSPDEVAATMRQAEASRIVPSRDALRQAQAYEESVLVPAPIQQPEAPPAATVGQPEAVTFDDIPGVSMEPVAGVTQPPAAAPTEPLTSAPAQMPQAAPQVQPQSSPAPRMTPDGFPADRAGNVMKPKSLIEFLIDRGGIRDQGGDIRAAAAGRGNAQFAQGFGSLIRKNGMTLDEARKLAVEAGYLSDRGAQSGRASESYISDLLDAIDQDAKSGRQVFSSADTNQALRWQEEQRIKQDLDRYGSEEAFQAQEAMERALDEVVALTDRGRADPFVVDIATVMAQKGVDFDTAAIEVESRYEAEDLAAGRNAQPQITDSLKDIPFFDEDGGAVSTARTVDDGRFPGDAEAEADAGAVYARSTGTGGPGDQGQGTRTQGGAEAGIGRLPQDGRVQTDDGRGQAEARRAEVTTEPGADGKPQTVIPGAEQISQREQAQRKADAALKPKVEQKDAGGMFGDDVNSPQLFDQPAAKPSPKKPSVEGKRIDDEWSEFSKASGTLAIPRAEMPQIKAELRGAMVNFLNARGISHQEETVAADTLIPTQAEFSRKKVAKAKAYEGGDRSILVANDGHILDGHHQWMAKLEQGEDIKIIRLDAPIRRLLTAVAEMPSTTTDGGATEQKTEAKTGDVKMLQKDAGLSEEFTGDIEAITSDLRERLDKLGLSDVAVRMVPVIEGYAKGERFTADGSYFRKLIEVSLSAPDKTATLNHEAIHALKNLNLFNTSEWSILSSRSQRDWIPSYGVEKAYEGSSQEVMIEEGVASAYVDWVEGREMTGSIGRLFQRIKDVIEALGNALRGRGFDSVGMIFERVESGEIGSRGQPATGFADDGVRFSLREKAGKALSEAVDSRKVAAAIKRNSKIDNITADDGETAKNLAKRKLIDYLNPVSEWIKDLGFQPSDMADPYLQARLAEDRTRAKIKDVYDKYVDPVLDEIANGKATLQDLHRYLYALHAEERNELVGKRNEEGSQFFKAVSDPSIVGASGMSTNEANQIIAEYEADPAMAGPLRRSAKLIRQMLDANLQAQKEAGLISQETFDLLSSQWKNYVPLKSDDAMNSDGSWFPSPGKGFDVRRKDVKTALGRFSEADNIILHSLQQTTRSMERQGKNEVGKAVLRLLNKADPTGEKYAEVYWSDEAPLDGIVKAERLQKRVIGADGKVTWVKEPYPINAEDVMAAKVGGKTYYIRFKDQKIGRAFKKMNDEQMNLAFRVLSTISNWQSIINTRKNPAFTPINIIRDAWTAKILLSHYGFSKQEARGVVADMPAAMGAMWRNVRGNEGTTESQKKWDSILAEWRAAGGQITFDNYATLGNDISALEKQIMRAAKEKTGLAKVGSVWRGLMDFIENVNDAGENAIRIAAYARSRQKGMTEQRAAFLARDLTVDFKKRGELGREANALYVFFNSSVQGNYNLLSRGLKTKAIQAAAAKFVLAGFVMSFLNPLMAGDDDDGENAYDKLLREQPYILERNIVVFIPGTTQYVKFPLPFGFNAAYNIGVQGHAVSTGRTDLLNGVFSIVRVTHDSFNPMGSGSLWAMVSPTATDPFLEVLINENFAGNPIYPSGNPYDRSPPPDSEQAFNKTNPAFKAIAEGMNAATGGDDVQSGMVDVHPDTLEHFWGFLTGGVGRFLSQTGESLVRGSEGEFEPTKTPFVRSFYGAPTEDTMKARYYNMRERVMMATDYYDDYRGSGRDDEAQKIKDRFGPELKAYPSFKAAESARRKLNKQRRYLESQPQTEAIKKRLKDLDEREAEIMLRARTVYIRAKEARDGQ